MNKLILDIGQETDLNGLTLLLYIDGTEFREIIGDNTNAAVFYEISASLNGSGEYLIFTCSCGVADCGGWDKVHVVHNDNKVIWTFNFNDKKHVFTFDIDNYKDEIFKMQQRINSEKIILQPQYATEPE